YDTELKAQPRFKLYLDEVDAERAREARTSVSLNLAARKTERTQKRQHELALDNAWRKLAGKPVFDNLKEADGDNFAPPDIPLDASADLFGEYIALAPPTIAKFTTVVSPAGGPVGWCIKLGSLPIAQTCQQKANEQPKAKNPAAPAPNPASGS
ncbi:MAG: carboxy terminal-processing peptidase, partial [Gammaproteobacteria bacterium]